MKITRHYLERANERFGMNETEAKRALQKALVKGKRAQDLTSKERSFLAKKEMFANATPVVYGNMIFIFTGEDICATVYEAPEWFGKKRLYENKELIRNPKRYLRYSPTFAMGVC